MSNTRIFGYDIARAVALFGMFAVHTLLPSVDNEPTFAGEYFAGKAAPLFAVLAGVSIMLISRRTEQYKQKIAARAVFIILVGFFLTVLNTHIAVILIHYGLLFFVALPFIKLSTKALGLWTVIAFLVTPVLYWLSHQILGQYLDSFPQQYPPGLDLLIGTPYPVVVWITYFLAGMLLYRLNIVQWSTKALFTLTAVSGAVWALLHQNVLGKYMIDYHVMHQDTLLPNLVNSETLRTELITGQFYNSFVESPLWFFLPTPHSSSTVDVLSSIAFCLAVIALSTVIGKLVNKSTAAYRAMSPLIGAGQAPLTLYAGHIVVFAVFLYSGLPIQATTLLLLFILISLIYGAYLVNFQKKGMLEQVNTKFIHAMIEPKRQSKE